MLRCFRVSSSTVETACAKPRTSDKDNKISTYLYSLSSMVPKAPNYEALQHSAQRLSIRGKMRKKDI